MRADEFAQGLVARPQKVMYAAWLLVIAKLGLKLQRYFVPQHRDVISRSQWLRVALSPAESV